MKLTDPVEFEHVDRRKLYDYVESHGEVSSDELLQAVLPHDRHAYVHHIAILKRDGVLEEVDGKLRVAIETDVDEEEVQTRDFVFSVRPARQDDVKGIIGAIRQVAEEKRYIVAESVAEEVDHQDALLRHNELESRIFFVAVVEDEVVGWAHINAQELEKLSHTAELTLGVIEDYRGHGIGDHLLTRALEWARDNGYEKVYQSVPATNQDAIEFLQEHGCEIEAVREDQYRIDGEYVDEVMLAIYL